MSTTSTPKTRTRTRGTLSFNGPLAQQFRIYSTCSESSWVANEPGITSLTGYVETMTDVVIPGFKRRQKNKEFFFNPMVRERTQYSDNGGYGGMLTTNSLSCSSPAQYSRRDNRGNFLYRLLTNNAQSIIGVVENLSYDEKKTLQLEVATRMLSERGRLGDSNLFESLAEADQALGLFNRPFQRLSQLLSSAARAKRQGRFPGYALNGMSNLWLAYRYGIRPIVSDVEGILKGLKKPRGQRLHTTRSSGVLDKSSTQTLVRSYGVTEGTIRLDIKSTYKIRCMSLDDVNATLIANLGFDVKNLATLPWELVPYSFVADWFFNVGDYLGSLLPAFGYNNKGSCMSVEYNLKNSYTIVSSRANPSTTYTMTSPMSGSYNVDFLSKSREPVPAPQLVIKSDFKFDKFTRSADAWTLLSQQFSRVFR